MKEQKWSLSNSIKNIGRPVTYYPSLARLIGLKESIFVCQIMYWTPRSKNDGWVYKSADDFENETGLTRKEQIRIRKRLVDIGLLEEDRKRTEHRIYFRVNIANLDQVGDAVERFTFGQLLDDGFFEEHDTNGKVAVDQRSSGMLPKVKSYKEREITTKSTHLPPSAEVLELLPKPIDDRSNFTKCKDFIFGCYRYLNDLESPWDVSDAAQLSKLLKSNPTLTPEIFHDWLLNYAESKNISPGARPRKFLPNIIEYANGPLNEYGRPLVQKRRIL